MSDINKRALKAIDELLGFPMGELLIKFEEFCQQEELKTKEVKPCEHETGSTVEVDRYGFVRTHCKHCGVKLKAKWETAE